MLRFITGDRLPGRVNTVPDPPPKRPVRPAGSSRTNVLVRDERGRPVAGAQHRFRSFWLDGDVQRLGFYTDADGRFTMPRVPVGKVSVSAGLGSRKARGQVDAGGTLELRLGE